LVSGPASGSGLHGLALRAPELSPIFGDGGAGQAAAVMG
jgi:hypothetical protein